MIEAGDGDDSITVPPLWSAPVYARGGDGSDALSGAGTLAGGAGDDMLAGGHDVLCPAPCRSPRDTLTGGSGNDILRGGIGDDVLIGDGDGPQPFAPAVPADGAPGDDVRDGGEGGDEVGYAGRAAPVRVDLADPVRTAAPASATD